MMIDSNLVEIVLDRIEEEGMSLHEFCNELESRRKQRKGVKGFNYLKNKFIRETEYFNNLLRDDCVPNRIKELTKGNYSGVYYSHIDEIFFIFKFLAEEPISGWKHHRVDKFYVMEFNYMEDRFIDIFPDKVFSAAQDIPPFLMEKGLI